MKNLFNLPETETEILSIVDENDIEVGNARREEIHRRAWRHRSVHIVVRNSRGQILLQRRSLMKDTYPGYWDISVGGHVGADETYEEAAQREIREELGVEGFPRFVGKMPASPTTGWEFVQVYDIEHEGPFRPSAEEVSEVKWIDPGEVLRRATLDRAWLMTRSGVSSIRLWQEVTSAGRILKSNRTA